MMTALFASAWARTTYLQDIDRCVMDRLPTSPASRGVMMCATMGLPGDPDCHPEPDHRGHRAHRRRQIPTHSALPRGRMSPGRGRDKRLFAIPESLVGVVAPDEIIVLAFKSAAMTSGAGCRGYGCVVDVTIAAKVLIVGGVLNLAYGALLGYPIVVIRAKGAPAEPKYLMSVHISTLLHGAVLLGLAWAARLSTLLRVSLSPTAPSIRRPRSAKHPEREGGRDGNQARGVERVPFEGHVRQQRVLAPGNGGREQRECGAEEQSAARGPNDPGD